MELVISWWLKECLSEHVTEMNGMILGNYSSGPMNSDKLTLPPHLSFSNRRIRWKPLLKTPLNLLRRNKTTQKHI